MTRIGRSLLAVVIGVVVVTGVDAGRVTAEVSHIGLDKFPSVFGGSPPELVAVTATVLSASDSASFLVELLSVDVSTGAQMGLRVAVPAPSGTGTPLNPSRIMYSTYFFPGQVIVLGRDLVMARLPVSVLSSGTPQIGLWGAIPAYRDSSQIGQGQALAEMAGSVFSDGKARLFIGTNRGRIMVLMRNASGSVSFDRVLDPVGGRTISDLGALPRYGRVDLGVAADSALYAFRAGDGTYLQTLRAASPDGHPVDAFKVFNPPNQPFALFSDRASLAFCDGVTTQLHFTSIGAIVTGNIRMDPTDVTVGQLELDRSIVYVLDEPQTGGTHVFYRPGVADGSSIPGCAVDVTDSIPDECAACPIAMTGDIDASGTITPTDILLLVGYIYRGGAAPEPCEAVADVDCNVRIAAPDVIRLVDYVFKGGPAPCNVCTLFDGEWTCP